MRTRVLTLVMLLLVSLSACAVTSPDGESAAETQIAGGALANMTPATGAVELTRTLTRSEYLKTLHTIGGILQSQHRDTYAGLYATDPSQRKATVYFTEDPEKKLAPYLDDPLFQGVILTAQKADYPLSLLNSNRDLYFEQVVDLGFEAMAGVDVLENRFIIEVLSVADVAAALKAAGITLPDHVVLREVPTMPTPES